MPVGIGGFVLTPATHFTFGPARPDRLPTVSLERVGCTVRAKEGGVVVDPTGDVVSFAFKADGTKPSSGDFISGLWETDATYTPATYRATVLVGPGSVLNLAAGRYLVWIKVSDNPEIPVRPVGTLVVW